MGADQFRERLIAQSFLYAGISHLRPSPISFSILNGPFYDPFHFADYLCLSVLHSLPSYFSQNSPSTELLPIPEFLILRVLSSVIFSTDHKEKREIEILDLIFLIIFYPSAFSRFGCSFFALRYCVHSAKFVFLRGLHPLPTTST